MCTHTCKEKALKPFGCCWAVTPTQWLVTTSASKSSLGVISNSQETMPCLTGEGVSTQNSTWILTYYAKHRKLVFASPVYIRYPLLGGHTHTRTHTHACLFTSYVCRPDPFWCHTWTSCVDQKWIVWWGNAINSNRLVLTAFKRIICAYYTSST